MDLPPLPTTPVHAVVETHHGVEVVDPYRQLENLADPEVRVWARAQADHAAAVLASIPGRDRLRERIDELAAAAAHSVGAVERLADGRIAFFKQPAGADLAVVCLRDHNGDDRVVVDPATLPQPADGHVSLSFFRVSPDGQRLLYGFAASGSEEETLRVRDLASGRDLPVEIDRLESAYALPSWMPDGRSFQDSIEFKTMLIEDRSHIARAFIEHLCTYALRRVLTVDDQHDLKQIEADAKKSEYRIRDIIRAVAMSDLIRKR